MQFFHSREDKIGIIICLFAAVIFGIAPPAAKAAYQDGANILFVVLLSSFSRFVSLFIGSLMKGHVPFCDLKNNRSIIFAGVCQALSGIGIMGAVYYMPSPLVIIILFMSSIFLLLLSAKKKEIKLNFINLSCTVLALIGLMVSLNVFDSGASYPMMGYALAIMACLTTFARIHIYQTQTSSRSPLLVGAESFAIALLCLLPLLFFEEVIFPETSYGFLMACCAGLSASLGTFCTLYGIKFLGGYKFSMIMKLEPIFTALFGVLLVNEILQLTQYIGILVVIGSLVAIQLFDKQKKV